MKKKYIILLAAVLVLIVIYNFSDFTNRSKITGSFTETAYIRNENNQGEVLIYYAYSVDDIENADYKSLGQTLPFNKTFGITTAYFFDASQPVPTSLSLEAPNYDTTKYKAIATYIIDKVGNRTLEKN